MKRDREVILFDLKKLIKTNGFIYAFCMIIIDDIYLSLENFHKINLYKKLNYQEVSFILGLLIQNPINYRKPKDPSDLLKIKKQTYELMEELHYSYTGGLSDFLNNVAVSEKSNESLKINEKEYFAKGDMLIESIFYSGTGVYDFQYLEFLEKKYRYDFKWLTTNANYNVNDVKGILNRIKIIREEKISMLNFNSNESKLKKRIKKLKKQKPEIDWVQETNQFDDILEFSKYSLLFGETEEIEIGWDNFYSNLIDILCVETKELSNLKNHIQILELFSVIPEKGANEKLKTIGDFNIVNSKPLIQITQNKYFLPVPFYLFQAVYESPFYWMIEDSKYTNIVSRNRGKVSEEITYSYLAKLFSKNNIYENVRIETKKGHTDTEIDILCIQGSKALCVQVKSKQLTILSKQGNAEQMQKDFNLAIQQAYDQGIICRNKILNKNGKFYDKSSKEIILSDEIDEVYIMCITTENYPAISHLAPILINKLEIDPYPISLSVFDLELLVHYLKDTFEFLYYIRQRIDLMTYFKAHEEITYLSYHLKKKLWNNPSYSHEMIDSNFAQLIDRNYYSYKIGAKLSEKGDIIANRWKNENFEKLINQLKKIKINRVIDLVFYLYDLSGKTIDELVRIILKLKNQILIDNKSHNFSITTNYNNKKVGITYYNIPENDIKKIEFTLFSFCEVKKYKEKADVWIGFGSTSGSKRFFDSVILNENPWVYDAELDRMSSKIGQGQTRVYSKQGRNDPCNCGSGLKYKKCCGKNL